MDKKTQEILSYGINSFAFLLPFDGEFELSFLCEKIEKAYSQANLKTNAVINEMKKYEGKIIRNYGRAEWDYTQFQKIS